jgi:phage terminase small subunit
MVIKLNAKQQRFVEEYLVDLNGSKAAIRAGYSKNTSRQIATELLSKPHISEAVAMAMSERSQRTEITAAWVLDQAVKLHLRCMAEVRPALNPNTKKQVYDDDGNAMFTFNAAGASRSLEIIGKHVGIGAFNEKVSLKMDVDDQIVETLMAARRRSSRVKIEEKSDELEEA